MEAEDRALPDAILSPKTPPSRILGVSSRLVSPPTLTMHHHPALALTLLSLCACTASAPQDYVSVAAIRQQHTEELDAFHSEQRRFANTKDNNGTIEFGELGDLIVSNVELIGWPGSARLRSEFTWVNTGKRTRRPPIVQLSILDEAGDDWRSAELVLGVTFGIEYGNGSTHSAWLEVPTDGLHLRPGWTWGMALLDATSGEGEDKKPGQ